MASYTGNLNLKKPAMDDDALITDINNNMDILDAAANGIQDALAIVANGNTHVAISAGQFVYVRNHTTLTEGLYVASSNIAANATLSTSNLTADSAGGLNALNSNCTRVAYIVVKTVNTVTWQSAGDVMEVGFDFSGTGISESKIKFLLSADIGVNPAGVFVSSAQRLSGNDGHWYSYIKTDNAQTVNANTSVAVRVLYVN